MKFLVFALFVCAANAASFGFRPFQPVQTAKAYAQITPQAVSSAAYGSPKAVASAAYVARKPVASAAVVAPKRVASAAYVVPKPVASAAYVARKPVASAAVVAPKRVASAAYVVPKPVASAAYVAPKAVTAAPFVAPQAVYKTANVVAAAPVVAVKTVYAAGKEAQAGILRLESDANAEGYSYSFETNNGISSQASGILKKVDNADVIVSQGSYQYVAPDGTPVQLSYVADENGYQPRSDLLPVGPPIPVAIQRALEYIRNHPYKSDI